MNTEKQHVLKTVLKAASLFHLLHDPATKQIGPLNTLLN